MKIEAYESSDYAGLKVGKYEFYYGYEDIVCKKHNNDFDACGDADCDENEWAFVARVDGKEIMRIGDSSLGDDVQDCAHGLVLGIGHYFKKYG